VVVQVVVQQVVVRQQSRLRLWQRSRNGWLRWQQLLLLQQLVVPQLLLLQALVVQAGAAGAHATCFWTQRVHMTVSSHGTQTRTVRVALHGT